MAAQRCHVSPSAFSQMISRLEEQVRARLFLVCRSDHALGALPHVRLKDLRHLEFIHTVRTGSVWQQTQTMLSAARIRDSGFEVAQFGTLAGLVENGFGISVVPELALQLCSRPGLVAIPIADRKAMRQVFMVKRRQRSLSIAAAAMWERPTEARPRTLAAAPA